jgi:hypothetical protein
MSLACYDPKLDPLADLAGDFDYLSTVERESWNARQWTQIAGAMGWAAALDQRLSALRGSRLGLAALDTSALDAFAEVSRGWSEEPARSDRAKIRAESLTTIRELSPSRLWRVESNVGLLPGGACYGLSHWRPQLPERSAGPQVVQLPQRSFLADAGPSYFGDPPPALVRYQSGCGWQTPLRLSLGTYPWIYGHRLQAPAPGLAWRSSGAHQPALRALEIATELWHAEGNLRQDARDVVAHWRHWRATTSPLFAALPDASDARTPGEPTRARPAHRGLSGQRRVGRDHRPARPDLRRRIQFCRGEVRGLLRDAPLVAPRAQPALALAAGADRAERRSLRALAAALDGDAARMSSKKKTNDGSDNNGRKGRSAWRTRTTTRTNPRVRRGGGW